MKTKLSIVIFLITLLITDGFSQNQILMKNGDKLDGEVISLLNGVVTVKFNGNNITLKQTDILTINFDKTKELTSPIAQDIKGELKGVVTYFFNNNYGDKPDVGTKVFLRKADTTNQKISMIETYNRAKVCKSILESRKNESCANMLKKLNADTKEGFDKLDGEASKEKIQMDLIDKTVKKATVDGNGNYSFSVEPGLYELIFISKGRTSMSLTEINGKIDSRLVLIKASESIVEDCRFDAY